MNIRLDVFKNLPRFLWVLIPLFTCEFAIAQQVKLKKKDLRRDISMVTTEGTIILRLYDSTPNHRDNFLRLVKLKFYDSILFHRVIQNFMIQAGDPNTRKPIKDTSAARKDLDYTLPSEFRSSLFHRKGVLAAARTGDNVNPTKASSASQFYIVVGKIFTDTSLDSVETFRLQGKKIPLHHREVYKTIGGTPHLDQNYTIFGEVVRGMEVVDKISVVSTKKPGDKPVVDVRIIEARLVKRKR
ncbi:MAG: peptidylprolyl isomerase, partial [Flavisolibacter sp.]